MDRIENEIASSHRSRATINRDCHRHEPSTSVPIQCTYRYRSRLWVMEKVKRSIQKASQNSKAPSKKKTSQSSI